MYLIALAFKKEKGIRKYMKNVIIIKPYEIEKEIFSLNLFQFPFISYYLHKKVYFVKLNICKV